MSAPAAAPHRTISQFCDHVCMYVRFRPDHEAITAELTAHLEDHKDAILEIHPDMTLWEAERRAVEAMGNPEELGRWLDSIHNPPLWLAPDLVRAGGVYSGGLGAGAGSAPGGARTQSGR